MWNGSREAQRQADAAWNAVKHRPKKSKKTKPKKPIAGQFVNYQEYLNSRRWSAVRRAAFRFHGTQCGVCQKTNCPLHVHHKTYARLGREKMRDLQVLCAECHASTHDIPCDHLSQEFRNIIG